MKHVTISKLPSGENLLCLPVSARLPRVRGAVCPKL